MKSYTRILLVAVVIVLAAVAVWKGTNHAPKTDQTAQIPAGSLAPLASVSPIVIAYNAAPGDWKTYASASAGFKVSYPPDWTYGPCAPGCTGWAPPTAASGQFALGIIESESTMDELMTNAKPYMVGKEDIKAGGNTWVKLTLRQPASGDVITSHFIAHGSKLWEFGTATSAADILAVYGQMIRSFTFTK